MGLFVARGQAIRIPGRSRHAQEGDEVTSFFTDRAEVDRLIQDGHLVERDPFADEPGRRVTRLGDVGRGDMIEGHRPGQTREEAQEEARQRMANNPNPWGLDPAGLQGLSLAKLNTMILERDPDMKPFETEAEARAQLTKDYKAPKAPKK